jgi:signal transduction histidine kinase/DNA-binding response OmpR family regulator
VNEMFPQAKEQSKLRLRTLLTLPFVALVVIPALIIAGSSLFAGLRAVDVLSQQLIDNISSRVEQAAVHQLEEAATLLRGAYPDRANAYGGSIATFTNRDLLEQKLFELTAQSRTSRYMFFGAEDGTFLGVQRVSAAVNSEAAPAIVRLQKRAGELRSFYQAKEPLDRRQLLETEGRIFDARQRSWYQLAKQDRKFGWTPVYVSFATRALVTTGAQPVLTRDDKLVGVLAADVELSELSAFMKKLTVSKTGVAYIVDAKGNMVASSTGEQPFRMVGEEQQLIKAVSSDSELQRLSAVWFAAQPSAPQSTADALRTAVIDSSFGSVDIAARPISRIPGTGWSVVVAVPRSDFTEAIVRSAITTFLVTLGALLSALVIGLWVVRRVTNDVERLAKSTVTTRGELPTEIPEMRLHETGTLAEAFRDMVLRVRQSLDTIRAQNDELSTLNAGLEQRVADRTEQLHARNEKLTNEISLRRRFERELREVSEKSIKTADDKAKFLAMLSHELRTPLQAIVSSGQMLSAEISPRPKELSTLESSAKSMLALVDGILSFSRLEAGRVSIKPSRFVTREVVDDAVRIVLAARAEGQRIPVNVTIAPDVPDEMVSDAGMIRQLLINLLQNAVKHGMGRPIAVNVAHESWNISDRLQNAAQMFRFSVIDQGAGISAEDQALLFQPFQQIGATGADPNRGSGLGLAIANMLANELSGSISVQSEVGRGAAFVFTVPVDATLLSQQMPSQSIRQSNEAIPRQRVLLVEDHDTNRELMTRLLERLNQKVVAVASGEAALDAVRGATFDLALLDMNLPGISGIETAQSLIAMVGDDTPTDRPFVLPPLCALTASDTVEDRAAAKSAGIAYFLPKPATLKMLEGLLRDVYANGEAMLRGVVSDTPDVVQVASESSSSSPSANHTQRFTSLDLSMLESLRDAERASGAPFLSALLSEYVEGLAGEREAVKAAFAAGNETALRAALHSMSGAAVSVGATALVDALKGFSLAPGAENLSHLESTVLRTKSDFARWLHRNDSESA